MHKAEHHDANGSRVVTQAQADACCASASSGHESNPSSRSVASAISPAVLGPITIVPVAAPALVISDFWRVLAPIPLASPPRHVLLSTFLI